MEGPVLSRLRLAGAVGLTLALALPLAVRAVPPLSMTLTTSATDVKIDQWFDLTVTATQDLEPLPITFIDTGYGPLIPDSAIFHANVAMFRIKASDIGAGVHHLHAEFAGGNGYGPITTNEVVVTITMYSSSMTYTWGTAYRDNIVNPDDRPMFKVRVTVATCVGDVRVAEYVNGSPSFPGYGNVSTSPGGVIGACGADVELNYHPLGTYHFKVYYEGAGLNENQESSIFDITVTQVDSETVLSASPNPVEVGSPARLTATVSSNKGIGWVEGRGTFTFFDGVTQIGAASPPPGSGTASIDVVFPAMGTRSLTASWSSGATLVAGSTSPPVTLTIGTNQAHATGFGLSLTSFYPFVDGYKDTVAINGVLQERGSVAIMITNATTGATVRTLSVPTQDAGGYSLSWNGRTAGGTLLPPATYNVRQVFTDALGATLTANNSVWLSAKKLVWYSGSKTLYANQYTAKGSSGASITSTTTYYRGMRITFGTGTPGRWGGLGYQFTLPTAVSYSSLAFWVLGSGTHSAKIGLHDSRLGSWPSGGTWIIDYFSPLAYVTTSYAWTHVSGSPTYNRFGRTVQGLVLGEDWTSGRYNISKVKLTYKYALLQ
jgi:hypothetical protein